MIYKKKTIEQGIVEPKVEPAVGEQIVQSTTVAPRSEKERLLELYKTLKDMGIDPPSKLEVMIANAE